MCEEDKENTILNDNNKDFLKLPETDNRGGMVLKSLSEQNVSNMKKVSREMWRWVVHQDLPLSLPLFITVVNLQGVADPNPDPNPKPPCNYTEAYESVTLEPLNNTRQ